MKSEEKVTTILIDTDLGCDCDDAGALAIAFNLARSGFCSLAALTNIRSSRDTDICLKVIMDYYSIKDVPIGRTSRTNFLCGASCEKFTRPLTERVRGELLEDVSAVRLMREVLVKSAPKLLIIVGLGPLVNLSDLLHSEPDDLSALTGHELIGQKVSAAWIMGGSMQPEVAEWNFAQDSTAAADVLKNWPSDIYLLPYESGTEVKTGKHLFESGSDDNPIKISYQLFTGGMLRESWDPMTVWTAVMGAEPYFMLTNPCQVEILADGRCEVNEKAGGKCRFLVLRQEKKESLTEVLDKWMGREPVEQCLKK